MFYTDLTVRDYECDQQGIVNNSVYLNYLQHARHEYGRSVNMNWLALNEKGVLLVLRRIEIDYLRSITAGDHIRVTANPYRKGKFRLYFDQQILLLPDEIPVLKAVANIACLVDGRVAAPPEMDVWFGEFKKAKHPRD